MSSRETKVNKVSAAQTNILCTFFEQNPEVIRGYKKTAKTKDDVQNKWKKITTELNDVGPPRDHKSWAKYLCNMKAKLKRKRIKWRQSCNGKGPIMCNADDFDEIRLRMLQVLRKDASNSQESQYTSDLDTEDDNNYDDNENDKKYTSYSQEAINEKPSLESLGCINDTLPPDFTSRQIPFHDEFDYFGKNVAYQLKTLPISVALESQKIILSVLKKQREKVLHETSNSNSDPLKSVRI